MGPAAAAGGRRGGKASTPALGPACPGQASERHRRPLFARKRQPSGAQGGDPAPAAPQGKGGSTGQVMTRRGRLQSLKAGSAFTTAFCCRQRPVVWVGSSCWGKSFIFQEAKLQPLPHQGLVSTQETAQGTGRGAQPGTWPQQEQPWAPWHGRMSPGEERGPGRGWNVR